MRVWPGSPSLLDATWDGEGVNFALHAKHATAVDLCLYPPGYANEEALRLRLADRTSRVWRAYLPDVHPGRLAWKTMRRSETSGGSPACVVESDQSSRPDQPSASR